MELLDFGSLPAWLVPAALIAVAVVAFLPLIKLLGEVVMVLAAALLAAAVLAVSLTFTVVVWCARRACMKLKELFNEQNSD